MHDFGKAADGFQDMVKGQKGRWGHRHEVLWLAFLGCIANPDSSDYGWIAATVCSHHRDASEILDQKYDVTLSLDDTGLDVLAYGVSDTTYREMAEWMTQEGPGFAFALGVEGVFALDGPAHAAPTQVSAVASTVSALSSTLAI